jgi:REP element-mobilizing transposase RayT
MVFSTKNREPFLNSKELSKQVFQHIKKNAEEKDIWLDCVNGWHEHAHCLISLGKEQSISKVAQLIKGESSFWINQNKLTKNKFVWQDDYWVVGVSESHLQSIRDYIHRQEEHHSKESFTDEVNEFMKKYGWNFIKEKGIPFTQKSSNKVEC